MSKLRVGVIGAGVWGEHVIWSYSSNPYVELVGISDLDENRAQEMAQRYGFAKVWQDYREMLESARLDIVSIVTPDYLHKEIVLDCAAKGINILLEKPMATNMDDCEMMAYAIRKSGVKFMTDYFQRWIPQVSEVKSAILRGDLGKIITGHAKIDDVVTVPSNMVKWAESSSPIYFIMIHNIDLVRWLINSNAVEIYAKRQRYHLTNLGVNTDDAVEAMITFENGATVLFESNWVLPRNFVALNDHQLRLVGTEGTAYIDLTDQGVKIYTQKEQGLFDHPNKATVFANNLHGELVGSIRSSVAHFVDCVRKDQQPLVSLNDSIESTRIACAVAQSLEEERVVILQ